MEWYRTAAGEVVFGEIGARAPGARLTDLMNFSCDIDLFTGWAEAVCHGRFSQPVERRYNAAMVIKRAQGQGRITHVEGLGHLMATMGEHIVNVDLVEVGQPRRDWRQTVLSDGIVVVRHPDLADDLRPRRPHRHRAPPVRRLARRPTRQATRIMSSTPRRSSSSLIRSRSSSVAPRMSLTVIIASASMPCTAAIVYSIPASISMPRWPSRAQRGTFDSSGS